MAPDPYRYFRVEARDLLEQLGKGILDVEKHPLQADNVPRLLRLAHTLKGAARVVKQRAIADLAHAVEDALAPLRDGAPAQVDAMLQLIDAMSARVSDLPQSDADSGAAPAAAPHPAATLRREVQDLDALGEAVVEAHVHLAGLGRAAGGIEDLRHVVALLGEQLRAPRGARDNDAKLLPLVEELHELVATLSHGLTGGLERVGAELRQVRASAERLRLVPAQVMFTALERTARDVAQSLGKLVTFAAHGGDIGLDGQVLGVLQGALVQVVRNAVAHGIETEAQRRAAGKPPAGQVTIVVSRRGKRVAFTCRDDGRGVDLEAVRRAAQRRGLGADGLDREELIRLLLRGGLTTAGAVTASSGRGVGLDVVRDAANRLGGEVSLSSEERRGTTVELLVPLSRAALEALIVEAGGQAAAIPLDAVRQMVRVAPADVTRTPQGAAIVLAGQVIPLIPLARSLRARGEPPSRIAAFSAVVIHAGERLAALAVDRLLGTESVVWHPLPDGTPADAVISGASFDAEGNPRLVLDPETLIAEAHRGQVAAPLQPAARPPILVIDDSVTTRMLEQSILESAGYEVDLAVSGEDALEKSRARRYALFLVDVEMPGIDGFTFIERARADPALRDVPAILVSSRNAPADRQRGEEVGARGYVVKSEFNQAELLLRIGKLLL